MLRRQVLTLLGASMAASVLSPGLFAQPLDPLRESAKRFAAARRLHPILAGWESVKPPGTERVSASIQGKWPEALRGTLFRNGPGLFERGGQRYQHWFDGDGLVQAWRIGKSGVSHQSRFVETPKFKRENKSGRFEVMAAGTTVPNARPVSGPDDVNTANISMLHLAGKTYALWEAGSAFEIDPDTLATIGPRTWRDDLEGVPFSAHPVYEPDGSIWNAGLFGGRLVIYHVGVNGVLKSAEMIELPRDGYMHSFTATKSKLVFVLAPLVRVRDAGSYFEGLGWKPELGSLMVVVDKNDLKTPRFAELAAGAAYHYADAWDEADGALNLRACWYDSDAGFISPMRNYVNGSIAPGPKFSSNWVEITLKRGAKEAQLKRTGIARVEFPIPTRLGQKSPMILLQDSAENAHEGMSAVLSLDANGKPLGHFDFGANHIVEEQLYVPIAGKRYTLGTVFNTKKARTGLVLMDLDRLADGPIAQAWLDRAMPLGFHGTFVG